MSNSTNSEQFRKKRDLLNQYADHIENRGSISYSSTIHVDDCPVQEDYHPQRIPLGSRPEDEMIMTNSGPVSVKKIRELFEYYKG